MSPLKFPGLVELRLHLLVVLALAGSWVAPVGHIGAQEAATTETATLDYLRETVGYLASDELEGRGVGTEGLDKAADFVAEQFQEIGLKTDLIDGTPFQPFEVNISAELGPQENNHLKLVWGEDGRETVELQLGEDFRPLALGGSGTLDAPLVFVGYGISAPQLKYDEYEGLDVEGKVVVILRKEPQQDNPHSIFDGTRPSQHALFSRKISNAYQQGAAGVVLINDAHGLAETREQVEAALDTALEDLEKRKQQYAQEDQRTSDEIVAYYEDIATLAEKIAQYSRQLGGNHDELLALEGAGNETSRPNFPVVFVKREVIAPLVEKQFRQSLEEIETAIDTTLKPVVGPLVDARVIGRTEIVRQTVTIRNVLGLIEPAEAKSDEVIVIGAHYDHLGYGGPGSLAPLTHEIHNGADDNASGTTALIEVARRLHAQRQHLNHRVLLIAFTGEERGLLGSAHYVKEPIFPVDKTRMMLNMDMVGRLQDNKLIVMGTGTAEMFEPILDHLNQKHQFELSKDPGGFGPSDHSSFYARKIPVLALFTGTHQDYHRPSDDADKINYEGMSRIIDFAVDIITQVDRADTRPQYIAVESRRPEMRGGSRPYFGSIPDFAVIGKGYAIQGVSPDSPADEAGLQGGDVMVELGGNRIGGLEDFDAALRKFKAGDKVEVKVLRGDEEVTLTVTLAPPR